MHTHSCITESRRNHVFFLEGVETNFYSNAFLGFGSGVVLAAASLAELHARAYKMIDEFGSGWLELPTARVTSNVGSILRLVNRIWSTARQCGRTQSASRSVHRLADVRSSSSDGELVHSLGDAGVVDVGEAVGAAADLWYVSDDLLGHGTPPPLPQARPEQQKEALQERV